MIGPFTSLVFQDYIISPLGLKKEPGKFGIIHDLSSPFVRMSMNSCIPTEAGIVSYHTVDTTV